MSHMTDLYTHKIGLWKASRCYHSPLRKPGRRTESLGVPGQYFESLSQSNQKTNRKRSRRNQILSAIQSVPSLWVGASCVLASWKSPLMSAISAVSCGRPLLQHTFPTMLYNFDPWGPSSC